MKWIPAISNALERIGTFMGVERVFLFRLKADSPEIRLTNLWELPGIREDQLIRGLLIKDYFPWLFETLFEEKRDIVISELSEIPLPKAQKELDYCREMGIQSFLMLPIVVVDAPLCALGLDAMRTPRVWDEENAERLRILGQVFANAIARQLTDARLAEGRQKLEVEVAERKAAEAALTRMTGELIRSEEEERRRIARDLHDSVNQRMAALAMGLQRIGDASESAQKSEIAALETEVVEISEEVRRLTHRLHPSLLEQLGLPVALEKHCDETARLERLMIDLETTRAPMSITPEAQTCLFPHRAGGDTKRRQARLGVFRPRRPSSAPMAAYGSWFEMMESDSKRRRSEPIAAWGLISMEERVKLLNGRIRIESVTGKGTEIDVWLPSSEAVMGPEPR